VGWEGGRIQRTDTKRPGHEKGLPGKGYKTQCKVGLEKGVGLSFSSYSDRKGEKEREATRADCRDSLWKTGHGLT